ncbi:MAG: hypothetical protein V4805_11635 [Pseudomonadota bacterium]
MSRDQSEVKLNFINRSNDVNNSQIVIFQKNLATDIDEPAVAWTVIKYCGQGSNHPFTYPMAMTVATNDSFGNYTPQLAAQNGQMFHVSLTGSSDTLSYLGQATSPKEVHIRNNLSMGAINASIFKDGRLLAIKTSVVPQQRAVFEFKPTLWIGVVSKVEAGQVMDSAIISDVNTELSLLGITSADIVMTGGGPGANSTPFVFNLENIVWA